MAQNNKNFEGYDFSKDIHKTKYQEFINLIRIFCKLRNYSKLTNKQDLIGRAKSLFKNIEKTCDDSLKNSLLKKFFGSVDNEPYAETLLYDGTKEQNPTDNGNANDYAKYLQNVVKGNENVTTSDDGLRSFNYELDITKICNDYAQVYKLYYNYFDTFHQKVLGNKEQMNKFMRTAQESIKTGQISDEFLLSWTYKVPKDESKKTSSNDDDYRPLVTFDFKSVLLQRVVLEYLIKQTKDQVQGLQFAYRDHYSKELLILALHQHIKKLKNAKNNYAVLFYDVTRAYNNVKHDRLLRNLKEFNIDKGLFNWLKTFLTTQKTNVCIRKKLSEPFIPHGIPQGSPLSPWLFVLYMNGIFDLFKDAQYDYVKMFLYADDITVVISHPNAERINTVHNKIKNWLNKDALMEINESKRNYYLRAFNKPTVSYLDTDFGPLYFNQLEKSKEKLVGFEGLKELLHGETDVYSEKVDKLISKTVTVKHACQALKEIFPNNIRIYRMFIDSIDFTSHILLWGIDKANINKIQPYFDDILKEIGLLNDEMPLNEKQIIRENYNFDVGKLYKKKARDIFQTITVDLKNDENIESIFSDPVLESAYGIAITNLE